MAISKLRLDKLLVDRGLAPSRERAQGLIIAGKVLVNDQKIDKAGAQVVAEAAIRHDVALVATNFGASERPRAYGLVASAGAVAVAVGPLVGGLFTTYLSWRWVFVVAAVINGIFVPLIWKVMPKLPPKQQLRYADAMKSLWTLYRTQPLLRESQLERG